MLGAVCARRGPETKPRARGSVPARSSRGPCGDGFRVYTAGRCPGPASRSLITHLVTPRPGSGRPPRCHLLFWGRPGVFAPACGPRGAWPPSCLVLRHCPSSSPAGSQDPSGLRSLKGLPAPYLPPPPPTTRVSSQESASTLKALTVSAPRGGTCASLWPAVPPSPAAPTRGARPTLSRPRSWVPPPRDHPLPEPESCWKPCQVPAPQLCHLPTLRLSRMQVRGPAGPPSSTLPGACYSPEVTGTRRP